MRWLFAAAAGATLRPGAPVEVSVPPGGEATFHFECEGVVADVSIWLNTFCQECDPLLLLRRGSEQPDFMQSEPEAHSFDRWQDDKAGHFVMAKEVGPEGGTVAVFNMNHFSDSELTGHLSIECSEYVAFDFLFWDHVKEPLCPRPNPQQDFCSGHGVCSKAGDCVCDDHHVGLVCESRKDDVVVAAQGSFPVRLRNGDIRYFKIRVPDHFPGGVVDVHVKPDHPVPLAIFFSDKEAPTKTKYDQSNFADWVEGKVDTRLVADLPATDEPEAPVTHSHWDAGDASRRLAQCDEAALPSCEDSCMLCVKTVSGSDPNPASCKQCEECMPALVACGPDCSDEPSGCTTECHKCMHCVHSNDPHCADCDRCEDCFPWAAKCGALAGSELNRDRFFYVGVLDHARYYTGWVEITAQVTIKVVEGLRAPEPQGWLAKVWDPYRTLQDLRSTPPFGGADGKHDQSVFKQVAPSQGVAQLAVNIFPQKPTLIHLRHVNSHSYTVVQFPPTITGLGEIRVLSARDSRPKTLFDFDEVFTVGQTGKVRVITEKCNGVWLAVFAPDAKEPMHNVILEVSQNDEGLIEDPRKTRGEHAQVLAETIVVFACVLLGLYACLSRYAKSLQRERHGSSEHERLRYASTPLAEGGSAEMIDARTEQRHMHRGGMGTDDGI